MALDFFGEAPHLLGADVGGAGLEGMAASFRKVPRIVFLAGPDLVDAFGGTLEEEPDHLTREVGTSPLFEAIERCRVDNCLVHVTLKIGRT